ncbi:polysaccharide biosynthesis protein [Portibacter lacus]|uniref:Nucleoside-diphosphate sugar epimerase n=1 Tax=Portibacter lacus TaxID=1099794 RepID=A0AA37SRJ0_9BACT|nr:polysaccharide biosynthesis protein [Portibacter lacus]GLR18872.1 nucleoside-diphosphate sugar epimerase [Portibacter lacus]
MLNIDIPSFIKESITNRPTSFFSSDIEANKEKLSSEIKGKKVLVLGGAGTIGSSFIKAILPFEPASLVVVDYSENGLTELTRDLRSQNIFIPKEYITYPFDFGSAVFEKMVSAKKFDIIACFAAHKHVRSEKDHLAIEAMINNNVFNTKKLIDLALKSKPSHFFSVSTDKAANPVNVMGASKKLMENVLMSYTDELKISTARFANVAFSNGSLLAGFIDRIMKRQPLSAPNDVKRYFVSPEESGQLCMLACLLGETSDIFFPKLEEDQMLTFSTIAIDFLKSMNLEADQCSSEEEAKLKAANWKIGDTTYPVYFFSTDTSGEKSFEEFYTEKDDVDMTTFEALGVIKGSNVPNKSDIDLTLKAFQELFNNDEVNKAKVVNLLSTYLPDFKHIETGKSLDQKM